MSTRVTRKRKRRSTSPLESSAKDVSTVNEGLVSAVWESFREEYTESVEQLPLSLHRNLTLLNELDEQVRSHQSSLLPAIQQYIDKRRVISAQSKKSNPADPTRTGSPDHDIVPSEASNGTDTKIWLSQISALLNDLIHSSEEKVNLAQASYDSVDRHVRLLDQAIREHDPRRSVLATEISDSQLSGSLTAPADTQHVLVQKKGLPKASERKQQALDGGAGGVHRTMPNANPTVTDMPIDPHEPRYCYCNQVSWGEMIACDAEDCEKEWFHLGCVGLTEAPKGKTKWYCDECKTRLPVGIRCRRPH